MIVIKADMQIRTVQNHGQQEMTPDHDCHRNDVDEAQDPVPLWDEIQRHDDHPGHKQDAQDVEEPELFEDLREFLEKVTAIRFNHSGEAKSTNAVVGRSQTP